MSNLKFYTTFLESRVKKYRVSQKTRNLVWHLRPFVEWKLG